MPADAPARLQRVMLKAGATRAGAAGPASTGWRSPGGWATACAHILGAGQGDVVFCDSTSINLYKILGYAWQLDPTRPVIVTERHNFPTDIYVAEGLARFAGEACRCDARRAARSSTPALEPDVGVLYLSHVDYRSSRRWNMAAVNAQARARRAC